MIITLYGYSGIEESGGRRSTKRRRRSRPRLDSRSAPDSAAEKTRRGRRSDGRFTVCNSGLKACASRMRPGKLAARTDFSQHRPRPRHRHRALSTAASRILSLANGHADSAAANTTVSGQRSQGARDGDRRLHRASRSRAGAGRPWLRPRRTW